MRVHNPYVAPRDGAKLGVLLRSAVLAPCDHAVKCRRARLKYPAKHRLGQFAG